MIRAALAVLLLAASAHAQDARYGSPPERYADGSIKRSQAVLREFQRIHPCPSTGRTTGRCPFWHMNHVIPLAACGRDVVENIHWVPAVMKTGPGFYPVDRWERKIYKCPGSAIEKTPMPDPSKFRLVVVPR